jgi:hypothetical protein
MTFRITTAALLLVAAPAFAQMTGVSRPDSTVITSDEATPAPKLTPRPSAAIPATATTTETYGPYVPYAGPKAASEPAVSHAMPVENPEDAMIVVDVPERQGELREGTLLKTKMMETLSTDSTMAGARFTAEVMEPIERNGRVIIPVGSILEGQVTQVHGGRRISGGAAIHLETRDVTLPDGTHYIVHAQVIDEGTLKKKDHAKETLVVMGGVTGAGAVSGAMIGGGVGAAVGAGIGAGVSTVIWLKQDRQATLPKDAQLVFSLTTPMIVTPMSVPAMSSLNTDRVGAPGAAQ